MLRQTQTKMSLLSEGFTRSMDLMTNSLFLLPIISFRNVASEHSFLQENYKQYSNSSVFLKPYTGDITKHTEISIF